MKKYLYIILVAMVYLSISCNKDFLDVKSPSAVDQDFVFTSPSEATKVLNGCYDLWRGASGAAYYALDIPGSDIECHPETYDAQSRHIAEGLYATELDINLPDAVNSWANWYAIANRANIIMEAISENAEYKSAVAAEKANDWTQLYGEAAVFRAFCYFNLIRFYGDVPYFEKSISSSSQTDSAKLISRDVIYDAEIKNLIKVEPLMFGLGTSGINAERFSSTFARALIGKLALFAGGYSTRRTDFDYGTVSFEQKGIEQWNAKYVRRTDYKTYYQTAKTYLEKCIQSPGSAYLIASDSRGAAYDNPFQLHFQNIMDLKVSPESLFEIGMTRAIGSSEVPYAFGRPSTGGSANAYPCKSYGQSRLYASFIYGDYSPLDKRRDVTVAFTANSGACSEIIIDFTPGSRNQGGLSNNKIDESRMPNPYTQSQRNSGCNQVQMRMADVILLLAETDAELGDEGAAKIEFTKVRSRAFKAADQATMVTNYINALSGDALKDAIQLERKLELAGEGYIRYDLIRTGKMPEMIKKRRDVQTAMVNGLQTQGYYTFPNGNTIPAYIYVKKVNVGDVAYGMTKMLTTQCTVPETDPTWPIRFPGWRGNCDLWASQGYLPTAGTRNLAIQGLFRNITGAEATALVAAGYVKTNWGITIVNNKAQYTSNIFKGYPDNYSTSGVPPRYFWPLSSETISKSNGLITNGYGFAQP